MIFFKISAPCALFSRKTAAICKKNEDKRGLPRFFDVTLRGIVDTRARSAQADTHEERTRRETLDDISLISYYFNVLASYASYYWAYYRDSFRDYPYEVQTAIVIIQWSVLAILYLTFIIEKKGHHRRLKERTIEMLEEHYGEAIDYVFDREHNWPMSRDEIHGRFDVDEQQVAKKGLLRNKLQKQMMCNIIYKRLMTSGNTWTNRRKNVHLLLNIFSLPAFLEQEVAFANLFIKMKALAVVRAFKLPVSPWVINMLMASKKTRVKRVAMYLSVAGSADSELDYFETDFFDKNSCIYDEIELGYMLNRRRNAGMKLPNLAHWARLQKRDETKCMFVRLMRRFDQKEYCYQLEDLFKTSKHKKLIEEIARTWGYLNYTAGEQQLIDIMLTQPDDTKVAIMHAVTRMASGKSLTLLLDGYRNSTNPHVRFEALRCMYNYNDDGWRMLDELEAEATEEEKHFFEFFHNPITISRLDLDHEQAYHPSVETVFNLSN